LPSAVTGDGQRVQTEPARTLVAMVRCPDGSTASALRTWETLDATLASSSVDRKLSAASVDASLEVRVTE
jgi:hypothetical protein